MISVYVYKTQIWHSLTGRTGIYILINLQLTLNNTEPVVNLKKPEFLSLIFRLLTTALKKYGGFKCRNVKTQDKRDEKS